jgi:glycosyltransferase involved in cell wall biosynthesis
MPNTPDSNGCGGQREPVIVLVNHISQHGHLDMYARLYTAGLLELGYCVVLIAPSENGIGEWVRGKVPRAGDRFKFVEGCTLAWHGPIQEDHFVERSSLPLRQRAWLVWQSEGMQGILLRVRHYNQRLVDRFRNVSASAPRRTSFKPLVEEIGRATSVLGVRPSLVLFLYLDMIGEDRAGCRALTRKLNAPWAGILFHPRAGMDRKKGAERFFWTRNARGAIFLDPRCVTAYGRYFPGLAFASFPDVTDTSVLPLGSELAAQLIARACGRTIVLQLGSISPHKGILDLIAVIRIADPKHFFFAIVGEVIWEAFGVDALELRAFLASPPENCLIRAGYLADERELNSIVEAADILYAVYRDFRGSSNTLTKASFFEKPVLVSDDNLMGDRVRQFRIGETVCFGDVEAIVSKLSILRGRPREQFDFHTYCREHSIEKLKLSLRGLLPRWIDVVEMWPPEPA